MLRRYEGYFGGLRAGRGTAALDRRTSPQAMKAADTRSRSSRARFVKLD